MSSIITQLEPLKKSTLSRNTRRSADWLSNKIKSGDIAKKNLVSRPKIGKMYLFRYLPKHKATLPYYDINPLIIPIAYYNDGFLALNMHYLPPKQRVLLLDKLLDYRSGTTNERSYMKLSYELLSATSRMRQFKPTLHRYLYSHMKTRLAVIPPDEWEFAVTLPLARFVGSSNTSVYRDSRSKY